MSGQMYEWIEYTWNPLAGECPHNCEYCYVKALGKRFPQVRNKYTGTVRIDEKALNKRLPKNRTIFVCSMNDLFAEGVPDEIIEKILKKASENTESLFLFQTKNPGRLKDWIGHFPKRGIFATTIESDKQRIKTNAPSPEERMKGFLEFKEAMMKESIVYLYEITIEPIMKFNHHILMGWLEAIKPDFISVGADSKRNNLPEPTEDEVVELVRTLRYMGFDVYLKKNLKRIAPSLFKQEA